MTFPDRLREARKRKGLTQKQVGIAIGSNERHYQRYESGESEPTLSYLIALADCLGVSIDYLAGRTDNPKGGID